MSSEHPHTPEPWVCHSGSIYQASPVDPDGFATNRIANMDRDNPETAPVERDSNADRAVACVNALAGIDNPTTAIAALVAAARRCGEELRLIAERHGESLVDFSPVHAVDDALRGVRQAPTVTS